MAAMRAGVAHWQAGEIEVGHGMVCKAYAILMITHGPTHPITKDLEVNRTEVVVGEMGHKPTITYLLKGQHFDVLSDVSAGDAYADRDGAEDVQAERVCLPLYERGGSEEQTDDYDARTLVCGGGNQEPLPPEEVTKTIVYR